MKVLRSFLIVSLLISANSIAPSMRHKKNTSPITRKNQSEHEPKQKFNNEDDFWDKFLNTMDSNAERYNNGLDKLGETIVASPLLNRPQNANYLLGGLAAGITIFGAVTIQPAMSSRLDSDTLFAFGLPIVLGGTVLAGLCYKRGLQAWVHQDR